MADENAETTEETQDPSHTEEKKTDAGPDTLTGAGKTFTQAELDKVIADRLARSLRKQGLRWH